MADQKPALVLHLASGGEPLLFAVSDEDATKLEEKLPEFVKNNAVESVQTKDGSKITVNFAHVVVAYIDDLQRKGRVFGLH
jgi:hypothetical protein